MSEDKLIERGEIILKIKKKALILFMLLGMLCFAGASQVAAKTADAVTAAKTVTGGKWVSVGSKKKYRYADGTYAKGVWLKFGSSIYRINKKGYLHIGWMQDDSGRYYAGKDGKVYVSKWLTVGKNKYYFQSNGVMAKSKWLTIDKERYYFQSSGLMARSKWLKFGKYYYYFKTNGTLAKNRTITTNKKTYYCSASGIRLTSTWVKKNGKKYYFDKNGVRIENKWLKSGGKYYYLGTGGVMYTSRWVGNYYVGSNGARKTNCVVDGYYLNSSGKKTIKVFKGNYIFVGDSRTVEMENVKPSDDILYIGQGGSGYDWLRSTGGETLRLNLKANPDVTVLLAFGINDYGNIQYYIDYYTDLIRDFPETEFYILSVTPVDEEKEANYGYSIRNSALKAFNEKMRAAMGSSRYIDAYSYMEQNGCDTRDGIHYTVAQYQKLYQFIMSELS